MPVPDCGAAITESTDDDTLATVTSAGETPFSRTLNPERGRERERARAMRATGNLLSIKCIQQRNSG